MLVALAMVVGMLPTVTFAAGDSDGTTLLISQQAAAYDGVSLMSADESLDVIGTGNNPFKVGTAAALAELATLVNGGEEYFGNSYAEASYIMVADIELAGDWTAIGTNVSGKLFAGTFDGGGYAITGLNVDADSAYQGLFGYSEGTIQNVTVYGSVTGANATGGIAGYSSGTVENCAFIGDISATNDVGGIVGNSDGTVENCFSVAYISCTSDDNGGIVGENTGAVTNCVALGETVIGSSTDYAFRIIGYNYGGSLSNNYAWDGMTVGKNSDNSTTTGTTSDNNGADLVYTAGTGFNVTWSDIYSGWTGDSDKLPNGDALPSYITGASVGTDEGWNGSADDSATWTGNGTSEGDPYIITTAAQLAYLAEQVADDTTYQGVFFKLGNDIDLNGEDWTAIGTDSDSPFSGTFDGDDFTISGLYINNSNNNQGLFGYAVGATIQNVNVIGDITGASFVAGVVGYNDSGTVSNCSFDGSVSGESTVGGVVGQSYAYDSSTTVENCYNAGDISCSGNTAGGVVGQITAYNASVSAMVKDCYNTGSVTTTYWSAGGVVGYNYAPGGSSSITVENCYNTGSISAGSGNVGGVVGCNYIESASSTITVQNCYNTANLNTSTQYVGGVVGRNAVEEDEGDGSSITVSCCYNTGNITGTDSVGGVVGSNNESEDNVTFTVSNCVSLANTITGTVNVGRVVGYNSGTAETGLYAWAGTNYGDATFTGVNGADLYYNSTTGFSESWTDMGFTETNGWTLPSDSAFLPTLMGELAQNPLANLQGVTITLKYTEDVTETVGVEYGGSLTADQIPAGTWENEGITLSTEIVHTADATYTLDVDGLVLETCPCGEDHDIEGTWSPIISEGDFTGLDAGNYYLLRDIDTTATITIDKAINLCLNGKTIDNEGGSSVITVAGTGTLNLYDGVGTGTITGGLQGVSVAGTLVMYGGSITGNEGTATGAGVDVESTGTFTMYGGSITANAAATGDGVYVSGAMQVAGTLDIQEVYLAESKVIKIIGDLDSTTVIPVVTSATPTAENPVTITGNLGDYASLENFNAVGYLASVNAAGEVQLSDYGTLSPCPCGENHGVDGEWKPLTSNTIIGKYGSLSGNYYLAEDISLPIETTIQIKNDVNLCLNGNTIEATTGYGSNPVIKIFDGDTLNIYDGDYTEATTEGKTLTDPTTGEDMTIYGGLITGGYNGYGGGIQVQAGGTLNLYGGTIAGNTASSNGGGVYVYSNGTFHMYGGSITGNTAYNHGGGVYMKMIDDDEKLITTTFDMTGGAITANEAGENGGGIYILDYDGIADALTIKDADISGNIAQMGGGIYSNAAYLSITDSTVSNNATSTADEAGDGAGIYLAAFNEEESVSSVTLTNVKILENYAERTGGGVYVETQVVVNMDDCTIDGNTAGLNGGGIYAGSYYDGAIEANTTNSTVTITGSSISGNTAQDGGGAYVSSDDFIVIDTEISGNFAVEDASSTSALPVGGDGAGIYISGKHYEADGVGYAMDSNGVAYLDGVTITGNQAAVNGGGIYLEGNDAEVSIAAADDVFITDNSAGLNGGGVYISTDGIWVANSEYTLSGNTAINNGDGIYNLGVLTLSRAPSITDVIYLGSDKVINFAAAYSGDVLTVATAVDPTAEATVVFTANADVGGVTAEDFTATKSYYTVGESGTEFQLELDIDDEATYYTISGIITDGANVSVSLVQGTEVIETTTTDSSGNYSFPYLEETGTYNIVATDGDKTVTTAVVLTETDESIDDVDATLSDNSSTLVIKGDDTPDVVVVGLNQAAEKLSTSIVLTVATTTASAEGADKIDEIVTGNTTEYLAIDLTDGDSTVIGDAGTVLEIIVPYDFTGKSNLVVYRYHDDGVDTAGATAFDEAETGDDGTFKLDTENGYIYIYAQLFSTYAVGYDVASTSTSGGYNGSFYNPSSSSTTTEEEDEEETDTAFEDVAEDDWFYEAVEWAVEAGITTGKSDTTFAPYDINTRAEAVTFLWRANGSPEVDSENIFVDVDEDDWYYQAVLWAVSEGITVGTGDGTTFSPDMTCNRGQIITMLHRMAGQPESEGENPFEDVAEDIWYADAVLWAVSEAITTGTTDTTFSPDNDCQRAEIVTFLYRNLAE